MARAACAGVPVSVFFPVPVGNLGPSTRARRIPERYLPLYERALSYCARCAVRGPCLDYALAHRIPDGVFGGLIPEQRAMLRPGTAVGS